MSVPQPLRDLIAEFTALPIALKLEYLADYAEQLPQPDAIFMDHVPFEVVP